MRPRRPLRSYALLALFGVPLLWLVTGSPRGATRNVDLLIRNARIVDGTGGAAYRGDLAIDGGRISEIAASLDRIGAPRVIEAEGRVVAPGFIDMMGQGSLPLVLDPASAESKLRQGITTMLSGEGGSPAPLTDEMAARLADAIGRDVQWRGYAEYFAFLESEGIGLNVVHNVGATQIRRAVLGERAVEPDGGQLARMRAHVEEAMLAGAAGVSTALIYPPATYASTDELVALCRVAARHGGVYFTHMRNEGVRLLEAIDEAIEVGRRAGIPVHIFHLKAAGRDNWPLMTRALDRIAEARAAGLRVTADIYPYLRNGIGLRAFIHPRHFTEGTGPLLERLEDPAARDRIRREIETTYDWENWYKHVGEDWNEVLVSDVGEGVGREIIGRSIAEVATARGADPWAVFFDLVRAGDVSVNPRSMNEAQKVEAMRAPFVAFDTDAPPTNPGSAEGTHPRAFGAFARVLAKYVREEGVLSLEEAVRRLASLPAEILGLEDRGRIEVGAVADLVIFDPDEVRDRATFTEPLRYSEGFDFVLVGGEPAIDEGRATGAKVGEVIRRAR